MNGLIPLSTEDFLIIKGQKGNVLCHNIRDFSLILFYSTRCTYCQDILPVFKKLPEQINGCQFGIVNISQNPDLIRMSKETVTPLEYVPYIVLYIDGKPYMSYQGPPNVNEIKRFVMEAAANVQKKQQFSGGSKIKQEKDTNIPAYTIGIPLGVGDKVCYLTELTAYNTKK